MTQVQIPVKKLNSGYDIPVLGYGTWLGLDEKFDFMHKDMPKLKVALAYAIDTGYRHIDTAHVYRVESVIGEVISSKIADGTVKREDLFITTKVWNHMHAFADVEKSVRASLKRLQLDYIDLVLMHWPISVTTDGADAKIDYMETWRGLEAVLEKGLARSIGVSNFNAQQLGRLIESAKVVPAMNQIEINLNLAQTELVQFCDSHGVAVTAYTPFGTMLPDRAPADSPLPKIDTPAMKTLAAKYNKTPTQIALRHLYQRGLISIPKSLTHSRILENASIFDFQLSAEDEKTLAAYDVGYRTVCPVFWQDFKDYPLDKAPLEAPFAIPQALLKLDD